MLPVQLNTAFVWKLFGARQHLKGNETEQNVSKTFSALSGWSVLGAGCWLCDENESET